MFKINRGQIFVVNTIFIVTSDVIHLYNYSNMFGVFAVKYVNGQDNTWYQGVYIFFCVVFFFFHF